MKPTIIIAEDHELVAAGITRLLEPDYNVVATASDGRSVVEQALALRPNLVLLDVTMPLLNGLDAARQIRHAAPETRIVFLTMHASIEYAQQAFRIGAAGYVLKHAAATELMTALNEVLAGRFYVSRKLADKFTVEGIDPNVSPAGLFRTLTPRQREVLQLISEGRAAKEIAHLLQISPKTVEFHKSCIMDELGVRTTAEMVRYAVQNGLVQV